MSPKLAPLPRHFKDPGTSFYLFGPRGTGKSTWTRSAFSDAILVDFLDPESVRAYSARPERLRDLVLATPQTSRVVVDEVQNVPAVLNVVHQLIEEHRGLQFVLTGSSIRKIKRADVDLMAGRALLKTMHPFMAAELGDSFDLPNGLALGMVPLVVTAERPAEVLRSYTGLYVQREVMTEGLVRNIGPFARFLEAVAFSHASVLNVSNIARECEASRKAVEGYLGILQDLLVAYLIPVFTRRARRSPATHPKLYLFDAGVFRSLRPRGPLDRPEEAEGAALEGLVVQHLRAWNAYRGEPNTLYYWRTRSGTEIDCVLYGEDGLWAIEVKNSRRVRPADLRSLRAFQEDYPEARCLLLHRGPVPLLQESVLCLPCEQFLKDLHPDRPIPA